VSTEDLKCPACGGRIRYKTAKEAFGSWNGLGVFDLIPGIRDLPTPLRFLLMAVSVIGLVTLVFKVFVFRG
jgi:hypothetical protein